MRRHLGISVYFTAPFAVGTDAATMEDSVMAEERKVVDTKLVKREAYEKCFKRASQLGLNIKANVPGERLEVEISKRTAAWWAAVIIGLLFYVVPGILVLMFWKPIEYCKLIFDENSGGATVTGMLKGESGNQFWNDVSGILL